MTVNKLSDELAAALAPFQAMAMFENCDLRLPESAGTDGDTPLHIAAIEGSLERLAALLPFVQNVNVPGDIGNTPLHCAVLWNHPEVARLLLRHGADAARENDYGDTPVEMMRDRPAFDSVLQDCGLS